jgi:hypothetical protein
MGDLVTFRLTKRAIYRAAKREMERMYQLTAGGEDPIASDESRELFELGLVEEVQWVGWESYCTDVVNRIFESEPPV